MSVGTSWLKRAIAHRSRRSQQDSGGNDPVALLVSSPLFDHGFYRSLVGDDSLTREEAAAHYVEVGVRSRLPLNPVHLPRRVLDRIWVAASDGDIAKLLWWMGSPEGRLSMMPIVVARQNDDPDVPEETIEISPDLDPEMVARVGNSEPMRWSEYLARIMPALMLLAPAMPARPNKVREWDEGSEARFLEHISPLDDGTDSGPLVSIVMPTWNRERQLSAAIKSVMSQTYQRWELIVVDDGSTDRTRDVVRHHENSDSRIRLISRPHEGVSPARNAGIAAAEGALVAFLDSDNQWRTDYLARMAAALREAPDADAVFGAIRAEKADGSVAYTGRPFTANELLVRNYVDLNALVARRDALRAINGFNEQFKRWVDYDLVLRLAEQGPLEYVPVIACDYEADDDGDRISTTEPNGWFSRVVEEPLERKIARTLGRPTTRKADVSVVLAGTSGAKLSREVDRLRESFTDGALEIIVALSDVTVGDVMSFIDSSNGLDGVVLIPLPGRYSYPLMVNLAASRACGNVLVVTSDCNMLREGAGNTLVHAIADEGIAAAQPLLSRVDGTLISAGREWLEGYPVPVRFLAGLAPDDHGDGAVRKVSALDAGMFAVRTKDWRSLGGFDVIFGEVAATMDFSLRLSKATSRSLVIDGRCRVAGANPRNDVSQSLASPETREFTARHSPPAAPIADAWRQLGWEVRAVELREGAALTAEPILRRTPTLADDGRESLRWAVKIGARFTAGGERWGDVPFANDLARSLRDFGHSAVVDRHHVEMRRASSPDDVVLCLRGRHPIAPVPGRLNVLWVISRPDFVTLRELDGFDGVFVASSSWAHELSERIDIPVTPLLQAANVHRFSRPSVPLRESGKALFVGGPGRRSVVRW